MTDHSHWIAVAIALLLAALLGGRHMPQPDPSLNPAHATPYVNREDHR